MKSQMSSFDIAAVVGELQSLVGLKVERVFSPAHDELFFRLTGKKEKKTVFIKIGRALWVEDGFRQADATPPTFAMLLRKHVAGKTLNRVSQHGFDRVVIFEFGLEPVIRIVAEMFGSGNVILVEGEKIIQPLTSRSWKARDVKAGKEYKFPPDSTNPLGLDAESLAAILLKSEKDLVRCLAVEVNLGGAHAEEVCKVMGMDKDEPAKSMGLNEVNRMLEIISVLGETLGHTTPFIVLEKGQATDVQPFWLSIFSEAEKKEFETFCEAAAEYFSNLPETMPEEKTPAEGKIARIERQIEQQRTSIERLEAEAIDYQALGDKLYASYQIFDSVLGKVNNMLADGNWQSLEKDIEALDNVESFEASTGIIELKVGDDLFRLDVRLNLNDNAAALYERAKKARHKKDGAMEALAEAEKRLAKLVRSGEADEEKAKARKAPTKRFWFEKFRWFVSSEGNLVIGGRDAKSNDTVVKKHLKDEDVYAHADVHGAASVVVKEGGSAGEATLDEARIFALCFSKAWKGNVGSGSAYWVKPDQVSKTPEPGEFLPKGAFVIRGKRNYSKKLEMRLAVGKIEYEGERKVMCAPVSAVASHGREYFVIEPGDDNRLAFVKKLSDYYNIPVDEIDRILPAGDIRIVSTP